MLSVIIPVYLKMLCSIKITNFPCQFHYTELSSDLSPWAFLSLLSFTDSHYFTLILLQKWDSWEVTYQVLLATDTAAKIEDTDFWVQISQLKKAPPDIWFCADGRDLQVKLIRKRSSRYQGRLLPLQMLDRDFIFQLNMKPFLLSHSFTLASVQKDTAIICIFQATDLS